MGNSCMESCHGIANSFDLDDTRSSLQLLVRVGIIISPLSLKERQTTSIWSLTSLLWNTFLIQLDSPFALYKILQLLFCTAYSSPGKGLNAMFVIERNVRMDKFQELKKTKNLTGGSLVFVVNGGRAEVFKYLIISNYYIVESKKYTGHKSEA